MNVEARIEEALDVPPEYATHLLAMGSGGLADYSKRSAILHSVLAELAEIGDETTVAIAARLQCQLESFEPSVTMIGQVKAGKTSLVNAMAGIPDLLPADVNPWTSVVTSLHMSPEPDPEGNSALFQFFDENEWDRLLLRGGRIGELASRAGADDELAILRQQVERMREKSRARLGRRFELLLGQEHEYGYFDKDLIERYVCLGEDFDEGEIAIDTQGRFADITKSADLYFARPEIPTRLCIRDTPGVNDTFMMREQITIRAIRDSRLCVVVLSAHQALSSVDMALIRLISNIKSRDVIIFVNRIDELSDPVRQVPEIQQSIRQTLTKHDAPSDVRIIFGSAYWANMALSGAVETLAPDSAEALINWAEEELPNVPDSDGPTEMIWALSGLPTLYSALADRIAVGAAEEALDKVARSAINLANGLSAANQSAMARLDGWNGEIVSVDKVVEKLDRLTAESLKKLGGTMHSLVSNFQTRVDRSHRSFLERATASLISHLERYGEESVWKYDPTGLRVLLRSAYQVFGTRSQGAAQKVFEDAAKDLSAVYADTFSGLGPSFEVKAPNMPPAPPPVFLGQTIALDLQSSWWKSWWQRRRGYQAFASNFYKMIMEETDPIVNELKLKQAASIGTEAQRHLEEFLADQRSILMQAVDHAGAEPDELKDIFGVQQHRDHQKVIKAALRTLNRHLAKTPRKAEAT